MNKVIPQDIQSRYSHNIDPRLLDKINKSKILKNTSNQNLSSFMKNTCQSMIQKGITTFVDFREGGLDGALLLKKVSDNTSIRSIILGRLDFHQNSSEIKNNIPFPKIGVIN